MRRLLSALALASAAFSQVPTIPPPIIQVTCKPGEATSPTRPYAGAKAAVDVVGLAAATGIPQTSMVEFHANFASIEDLDKSVRSVAHYSNQTGATGPMKPYACSRRPAMCVRRFTAFAPVTDEHG
jgi:hypothetical protein